jgi:hypothetical protein
MEYGECTWIRLEQALCIIGSLKESIIVILMTFLKVEIP